VFRRALRDEDSRKGLVLQLGKRDTGGFLVGDDNQDRSEVLGTSEAVLYTGRSVSKYSTSP
jgi:hypothetical protein